MSKRVADSADESCLVVEHGQAKLVAAGRNFQIDRQHHAFSQNLLVSASVKRAIHFIVRVPRFLPFAPNTHA